MAVAIIPARLASTRLAEKVLLAETGTPLVQHAAHRAALATSITRVVIAADHHRIIDAVAPFGTEVVLTDAAHPNGTSRLAEAADLLGLDGDEIVVNVQGDEPELDPGAIDAAVKALDETGADIATVATPLGDDEAMNLNVVKVVRRLDGLAMYFSRSRLPSAGPCLRHVGLYVYRRVTLERYASLDQTPCEQAERLEQLRALEHGMTIAVALRDSSEPGIDTREQYDGFLARWRASRG